jgi:hypothetical protein
VRELIQSRRPLRSSGLVFLRIITAIIVIVVVVAVRLDHGINNGSSPDCNRSPRPKGRPRAELWSTGADLLRGNSLGYVLHAYMGHTPMHFCTEACRQHC